ncbi:MAG: alpha/beta hydrolase [Xanthomonadaceae bacterium]|nr:alpha/beta hydrolase [Xanthomonadaceae bacterium]MDE1965004.1 alpha/beta hydrolase [Xanthomonadaceae bacterium]
MSGELLKEIPGYFGPQGSLFGLMAEPAYPPSTAVLLCPPLGQDLIRSHRLYRQLAHMLVRRGLAVMRFDYYGSGDSFGDADQTTLARCVEDTLNAAGELRQRTRCRRLLAFGARLGGSIALQAHARQPFDALMLCDPILDGPAHRAQLEALHAEMLADTRRFVRPRTAAEGAGQWLGFPHGEQLEDELAVMLLSVPPAALLLDSADTFPRAGNIVALDEPLGWDDLDRLEVAIQSHELIARVQRHMETLQ